MNIDNLPEDGVNSDWAVYASVDNDNQVIFLGLNQVAFNEPRIEKTLSEMLVFTVTRKGKMVIVESCGWCSNYRVEVTATPENAVKIAYRGAQLVE